MKKENKKVLIDGLDKLILKALMINARKSIKEIAKTAGISGAAVHQRLKKLEKTNLISGSQLIINPKVLGYKTMAFIGIYLDKAIRNPDSVSILMSP